MRKARSLCLKTGILLVGLLVLVLFSFCAKKPKVGEEKPKPPEVTQPEQPPEIPQEGVESKLVTQGDLQPIYFDFDKYDLRPGDREILNQNAKILKEHPNVKIRIEGNCDERGTVEYNLALGERRARAAMDYLTDLGVDSQRISIISYGKEKCRHCQNDECWSKDRRDDFVIVSQ
jgi:peptidoglycan-associated lipoprotein